MQFLIFSCTTLPVHFPSGLPAPSFTFLGPHRICSWHCNFFFAIALAKEEIGRILKVSSECKLRVLRAGAHIQNPYLPSSLQWLSELIQAPYEKMHIQWFNNMLSSNPVCLASPYLKFNLQTSRVDTYAYINFNQIVQFLKEELYTKEVRLCCITVQLGRRLTSKDRYLAGMVCQSLMDFLVFCFSFHVPFPLQRLALGRMGCFIFNAIME